MNDQLDPWLESASEAFAPAWNMRAATVALAGGAFVSVAGDRAASTALALRATDQHSAELVSVLFVAQLLPAVVFGALGGRFVDRHDLRSVQIGGLLAQSLTIAIAGFVGGLWIKAALLAGCYCFGILTTAAGFRARRHLFGHSTAKVNGVLGAATTAGMVAGTAVAGLGLAFLGLRDLLIDDAGTFVVFAIAVAYCTRGRRQELRPQAAPQAGDQRRGVLPELTILRSPSAFGTAGLGLVLTVAVATSFEGVVSFFYFHDVVRFSATTIGVVLATWSVGMAVAAAAIVRWSWKPTRDSLTFSALGMGAAITASSQLVNAVPISAAYVGGGASNAAFSIALSNVVHDSVPQEHLAATWSVLLSLLNACFLVGFIASAFGSAAHPRVVMAASGIACLTAGTIGLATRRRLSGASPADGTLSSTGSRERDDNAL